MYKMDHNKTKAEQTACATKYPQGRFKPKPCRECVQEFTPNAPSELYCSDPCKDRGIQSAYLKRTYGITLACYEEMHREQDGLCGLCGEEGFAMDPKRHLLKLVVDHCHASGAVRGLLCHNCNRALGLFKDRPDVLRKAAKWVE